VDKIDGETQLGCAPLAIGLLVFLILMALMYQGDHTAKRVDAIEKALAAKEQGK